MYSGMALTITRPSPAGNTGNPHSLGAVNPTCSAPITPATDAELGIGAREMDRDGVHDDDQRPGDLLVGEPLCGELGRATLRGRQLVARARPVRANPHKLGAGLLRPSRRAELREFRFRLVGVRFGSAPRSLSYAISLGV